MLVFPMSFGQEQLWYLYEIAPESSAYNIPFAFRIRGPLDARRLESAIGEALTRHEALRTRFGIVDGQPRQVVSVEAKFSLEVQRLDGADAAETETEIGRLAAEEATRPFDLRSEFPFRARLLEAAADDHVLLLNFHHIALDHLGVLEVSRGIQSAYAGGGASPNEDAREGDEENLQFSDFAVWQREQLSGESLADDLGYWVREFEGFSGVLRLPTDHPRPGMQTFVGREVAFEADAALSSQVRESSRRLGVSLFISLLTVAKILLYRYSRQPDIVVGCPFANRLHEELSRVVGLFMNPLPICTEIDEEDSFRTLVGRVKDKVFAAQKHQSIPFEKIVQTVERAREPAYNPLVQVLFTVQDPPMTLSLPGLSIESLGIHNGGSKLDLSFWLWDEADGIRGLIEYNADIFGEETARRLARHFTRLMRSVVDSPDTPVARLPLLDDVERNEVLESFNRTDRDYEHDICLHELLERAVDAHPGAAAVRFESETLTYAELDARANRLARYLREQGVGPDGIVAVCAERSLELVVALLGILKAGGAYVPLDPEYPEERLRFMLEDSGAKVVLTQARLADDIPGEDTTVFCLDRDWPALDAYSEQRLENVAGPRDLAYMIYTSGSTGRPKGAMNEHRGIVNRLAWMQEQFALSVGESVLQKTPSSFDVSVWEFFWPLLVGGRLVLARPGGHQDPAYLADLIEREQVGVVHFVPSMLDAFLRERSAADRCGGLRLVLCSGEALSDELQQRFFELFETTELHNLYGPTEAAVDVTHWACRRDDTSGVVPIGKPVANTRIYLLDRYLEPVPVGIAGELHIGGIQVGRGYWNRPELTAERFIEDPFSPGGSSLLYKTGDSARYRPDGTIEYLGRLDDQVKIRGFRIELGEVEAALRSHASVAAAAARVFQVGSGDQRLVGYVTPSGDREFSATDMRKFLRGIVPEYMIPQHFFELDMLPSTPSGKLDRKALPEPPRSAELASPASDPPRTDTERLIAAVWAEVIGAAGGVSRDDNFFDLGGHSLLAIRAIARIEELTGWRPSMRLLILENVGEIAARCDESSPRDEAEKHKLLAKLRGLVRAGA